MKAAAAIIGIMTGFISLMYVGMYGGMVGSAVGWMASFGPSDNDAAHWAEMVKALSWLAPVLVIGGGGAALADARVGAGLLGLGTFLHWYLLGFGSIGNLFIIPSALAAVFAATAAFRELDWSGTTSVSAHGHFCAVCGAAFAADARFCGRCGMAIPVVEALAPTSGLPPAPFPTLPLAIGLGIGALALGLFMLARSLPL
jgi:hypothetical protein